MKQRRRIYYSAVQRSEIWDRWQAGESMSSIGRRFDRESSSVFSVISPTGGIRPPDRHRAKQALTPSEREEISRWLSMRRSLRSIARHLGRSASTVSREVSRNGGVDRYRAHRVRSGRLGSGAASQALQAGLPPVPEADSIDWAAATMVAGTNSWLAQAHISGGATKSGVTRDDLSQPVHSGARCAEKRAA
jgi:DNA-binding CsgD family transcriptional regulator